jgi:hypothetical protein
MLALFLIILLIWLYFSDNHKSIVNIIDECRHEENELCKIMAKSGSDKSVKHKYTRLYYDLFSDIKNKKLNIFEVGIGTKNPDIKSSMYADNNSIPGGSHRGWKQFFKNSNIYGADIDKDILFSEDRIKTYYTNQLEPNIIKDMWNQIGDDVMFDIIIDDGLHTDEANYTFLMNSHHKLNSGGIYVIEDVQRVNESHLKEYEKIFKYVKVAIMPNDPECLIVLQK